jgi:hypothetical protein
MSIFNSFSAICMWNHSDGNVAGITMSKSHYAMCKKKTEDIKDRMSNNLVRIRCKRCGYLKRLEN